MMCRRGRVRLTRIQNQIRRKWGFVKIPIQLSSGVAAVAIALTMAGPAFASNTMPSYGDWGTSPAVFMQTDNTSGNQVIAYQQAADGTLTQAGTYSTGALGGSVVDHLASQGSLQYDPQHSVLFAVNAGSNTVTVFAVSGDRLALRQVVSSGGTFPVSVAVHGDLVYVLNALNGGSVQGYLLLGGHLLPLPGSSRALGLDPTQTPQFTSTPGQVAFTPDGRQLIVTTKNNGNDIDVFSLGFYGLLSASPVVNAEPGTLPFAITFDAYGHLVIAEAGTDSLAAFTVNPDGTVSQLRSVSTGQSATCWVASAGQFLYASNAGSASESRYASSASGQLALLGATGTDAGTTDAAAAARGQFLYVRAGAAGIVDEYSVGSGGSLTRIGSVTVPDAAGGEGIAAS
jgi:6-phosphogluconolactonase (cycloisomerase 2 family)